VEYVRYMPWPQAAECNMITNKQTTSHARKPVTLVGPGWRGKRTWIGGGAREKCIYNRM